MVDWLTWKTTVKITLATFKILNLVLKLTSSFVHIIRVSHAT